MLELLLCSLLTIVPDYLFRRYAQGRRIGKEITLYSVWFELRWGITGCVILTVLLITTVFYNHPATTNVTLYFRTVPILPETTRRTTPTRRRSNSTTRPSASPDSKPPSASPSNASSTAASSGWSASSNSSPQTPRASSASQTAERFDPALGAT